MHSVPLAAVHRGEATRGPLPPAQTCTQCRTGASTAPPSMYVLRLDVGVYIIFEWYPLIKLKHTDTLSPPRCRHGNRAPRPVGQPRGGARASTHIHHSQRSEHTQTLTSTMCCCDTVYCYNYKPDISLDEYTPWGPGVREKCPGVRWIR
jgi:hypothetical protein